VAGSASGLVESSPGQPLPNTLQRYMYNIIATIMHITTHAQIANNILELSDFPPELFPFSSIVIIHQEVKII
jgi:hypothetical protein